MTPGDAGGGYSREVGRPREVAPDVDVDAAVALKANHGKPTAALARELGVPRRTVERARVAGGFESPARRGGQPDPNASGRLLEQLRACAAAAGMEPAAWIEAAAAALSNGRRSRGR